MNTTEIGDKLEVLVFAFLEKEIEDGKLPFRADQSRVRWKPSYYSRDREDWIQFDVSVEVLRPGGDQAIEDHWIPSWIVECKNEERTTQVGKADEFFTKLRDVGPSGIKGVLCSRSGFQKSTEKSCRSKGIWLLVYHPNESPRWLFRSRPSTEIQRQPSLIMRLANDSVLSASDYRSEWLWIKDGRIYEQTEDCFVTDARTNRELALAAKHSDRPRFIGLPKMEELTELIRQSSKAGYLADCLDRLAEYASRDGLVIKFEDPKSDQDLLGQICFETKEVIICKDSNSQRMRFTLAHELGHYFLRHGQFLIRESVQESDFLISETTGYSRTIKRLEIQANSFAASFLMPKSPFLEETMRIRQKIGLKNKGFGLLYVDNQSCNREHLRRVLTYLCQRFDVSRTACELRLRSLGLIHYGVNKFMDDNYYPTSLHSVNEYWQEPPFESNAYRS